MQLPEPGRKGKTILALGDSYTIGTSVAEQERWTTHLLQLLRAKNNKISEPEIFAQNGWTTSDLLEALNKVKPAAKYDLITLQIGVNNQYQEGSLQIYRAELSQIIEKAISLAGNNPNHIIMLSVPDWGVTPVARRTGRKNIAEEINAFNTVAKEVCTNYKIGFVDITPLSKSALADPKMIATDGLHFSGKMYRLWAEKALPAALKILQ